MIATWTLGLLRRRRGRLAATAAGIAAAVALLACLGSFLAAAQGSMTARAIRSVTVDWQVEVQPDTQPSTVVDTVRSAPNVQAALPVGYAHSTGFVAQTGGSTQTTGPAMVLGIPPNYREQFPGAIRTLVGADNGVLIAQQTAANLHAAPGDTIHIGRAGIAPVDVVVDGVVDLPQADSLFQKVSAPVGAQPAAPPDNVLILGQAQWNNVFDPLAALRPDLVSTQIHTALEHTLPPDPGSAYTQVSAAAHNLEARTAGGVRVGDNLGAALDAARSDAAYARVLFVFLGLPAAVLAALLTATVVTAGADRRRQDQALLRARGASQSQLIRLAAAEALVVGTIGSAVGLGAACLVGLSAFGSPSLGADPLTAIGWAAASAAAGLAVAAATVLAPAWRDLRDATVTAARARVRRTRPPRWTRFGLDVAVLAASGTLFWLAGRGGYQIVLAPEGVPTISVSYWAFVAPALLWIGAALLVWRLADLLLGRGWPLVARALRPLARSLSRIVAHSLSRQRAPLARAVVLLALALAFAASTATFNATYQAQAEVDAQLTNGADVTVTQPPGSAVPPDAGTKIAAIPGVRAVEPLQHRFAYIGADLQDLYGVNPASITTVTALRDNYFHGGTVAAVDAHAGDPAGFAAGQRRNRQRLPTPSRRRHQPAAPGRAHPPPQHRRIPLHRGRHRIPDRTQRQLLRRQRRLHRPTHRQQRRRGFPGRHRRPRHHRSRYPDPNRGRDVGDGHRYRRHPRHRRIEPDRGQPCRSHPNRARVRTRPGRRVGSSGSRAGTHRAAAQLRHRPRARRDPSPAAVVRPGRNRHPRRVRSRRRSRPRRGPVADAGARAHRDFRPAADSAVDAMDLSRCHRRRAHRCDQRGVGRDGSPCATLSADGAGRAVVLTAPGWAPTKQSDVRQQPGSVISFAHPDTCHSSTRHRTEWYCARVGASVCSAQIGAPGGAMQHRSGAIDTCDGRA